SWAHKNLEEVLNNCEDWKGHYLLKIVAANSQHIFRMKQLVKAKMLEGSVEFLSDLDEPTLSELYRTCCALLYPSKMEGFGIPPLEAMACGSPVIVSDIPVFREIYGSV